MRKNAVSVVGLGFGDEGKGATVDFLARHLDATLVVKSNGGCQSQHNVVDGRGRHFCFSQFGSASFAYADTHISEHFLLEPLSLEREALALADMLATTDPFEMLTVEPSALVTTLFHQQENQRVELLRGEKAHGSTGRGIGKTVEYYTHFPEYSIFAQDLSSISILEEKLGHMAEHYENTRINIRMLARRMHHAARSLTYEKLENVMTQHDTIVFEHSQGILLDEYWGFAPHNTWSICTSYNSREMISGFDIDHRVVGCLRAYMTRHGKGPFPTESPSFTESIPEPHNHTYPWAGAFRAGYYDEVLLRYALRVDPHITSLALSHTDYHTFIPEMADLYRLDTDQASEELYEAMTNRHASERLINGMKGMSITSGRPFDPNWVERSLNRPISVVASGPKVTDRQCPLNPFEVEASSADIFA